ncbi:MULTISPECIES: TonB system transport protein ExbD [Gemmobacter]|jgi:TonB system transport protein ExbD (group 1)|uniref:Biopolymer transport protein ExbD n=1 Tax=Gemmobacter caeni TaxID=589035 RepID=A0A2T6ANS2_9RHOB|nr:MULTISPECIES: TonB system transport protein ExbD [Gemmobacter]OJY36203.1 MAG: TonB system transport protein ExbD [Rhodobacterales bacterium 65-51]PTX45473.1 outer membrane transport energization protein ExbD [Gemmobacter caeni]TWI93612.1 outer membrane transport energization protein ExbD (TC 2.C.1.1.1) [Gemmobacter caeni]
MAFSSGSRDEDEIADINVTPFIDVMLVLLIVFMVAAPLSTVDVPVNLPASSAPPREREEEPLWLTLTREGDLRLGEATVSAAGLGPALDRASNGNRAAPVLLRADSSIPYGDLMRLLDALRAAGYLKVALVGLEGGPRP